MPKVIGKLVNVIGEYQEVYSCMKCKFHSVEEEHCVKCDKCLNCCECEEEN